MTDKEFHKLKRQDVLRLLLAQVKEAEELRSKLAETEIGRASCRERV